MTISKEGLDLIKEFEGFSSEPYKCPAGVPTIGYCSTHYEGGRHVTLVDRHITEERATEMLKHQVDSTYSSAVNRYVNRYLTQNQFDALVSFTYNLGAGALKSSTLLKDVNKMKDEDAGKEFLKWTHAGGRVLNGLLKRRTAEAKLYLA